VLDLSIRLKGRQQRFRARLEVLWLVGVFVFRKAVASNEFGGEEKRRVKGLPRARA
jgi:hypothetical protein